MTDNFADDEATRDRLAEDDRPQKARRLGLTEEQYEEGLADQRARR